MFYVLTAYRGFGDDNWAIVEDDDPHGDYESDLSEPPPWRERKET